MRELGKVGRGGISPRLNEAKIKMCVLSSNVTFEEVLLIRTCIMNVSYGRFRSKLREIYEVPTLRSFPQF